MEENPLSLPALTLTYEEAWDEQRPASSDFLKEKVALARTELSPMGRLVYIAEAFYANREELVDEARDFVAATALFATSQSSYGMNQDDRGVNMAAAMRRDMEAGEVTIDDADPKPMELYAPPAPLEGGLAGPPGG